VARSDLMTFWKFLTDTKFTGSPSKLIEDDVWRMVETAGLLEHEIEAVPRGYREFMESKE
jgi:hypothetical protein